MKTEEFSFPLIELLCQCGAPLANQPAIINGNKCFIVEPCCYCIANAHEEGDPAFGKN